MWMRDLTLLIKEEVTGRATIFINTEGSLKVPGRIKQSSKEVPEIDKHVRHLGPDPLNYGVTGKSKARGPMGSPFWTHSS